MAKGEVGIENGKFEIEEKGTNAEKQRTRRSAEGRKTGKLKTGRWEKAEG